MGKNIFVIILILSIFTISCEKTPNAPETNSAIIVQAYLYANEPINDIRITTLGENKGLNSQMLPVNDATVSLIKQEIRYLLTPSPGDSGYYFYPGNDLVVEPGDIFQIEVDYQENVASGLTNIPGIPKITRVSADTFFYDKRLPDSLDDEIIIEWRGSNNEEEFFFVKIDYINGEPGNIYNRFPLNIVPYFVSTSGQYYQNKWSFKKYSFRNDGFILTYKNSYNNLSKIREGWHCFYINQVTKDFIDLYETKFNYWGKPNKQYSNIENGFGIFAAFGVDSTFFYAKEIY